MNLRPEFFCQDRFIEKKRIFSKRSYVSPWAKKVILFYVELEVFTATTMKITRFWKVTPCSPMEIHRRFGRNY
jgi:hypothetical protein